MAGCSDVDVPAPSLFRPATVEPLRWGMLVVCSGNDIPAPSLPWLLNEVVGWMVLLVCSVAARLVPSFPLWMFSAVDCLSLAFGRNLGRGTSESVNSWLGLPRRIALNLFQMDKNASVFKKKKKKRIAINPHDFQNFKNIYLACKLWFLWRHVLPKLISDNNDVQTLDWPSRRALNRPLIVLEDKENGFYQKKTTSLEYRTW